MKANPEKELYSYAGMSPKCPLQDPCENSEEPKQDFTTTDVYKLIGPQKCLPYDLLKQITNNFQRAPLTEGGRVIGAGGFGDVFLGIFDNGHKVAVKRLKNVDEVDKQFQRELEALIKYRHANIVNLYAYSIDAEKCLVYEYLVNGSLEDRLHCKYQTAPLSLLVRLQVLHGTAQGIAFLNGEGFVHRDIKSANILLDENYQPKIGDFATARTGPMGNATAPMTTSAVIGTSAYLAPEAMNYDVSTKLDSYSFGVIILEVLTGLPPWDITRKEAKDLKSYVELEEHTIYDILDNSGGQWKLEIVDTLMEVSEHCTQFKKKHRCNVEDILLKLEALSA